MKLLPNYYLLLFLVTGCSHNQPAKEVSPPTDEVIVVKDPATLPVEVDSVLDQDRIKEPKNYFKIWDGLTTSKDAIEKLIPVANCILNHQGFLDEMRAKKFSSTDKTGEQVVNELHQNGVVSTVSTYKNSRFSPFVTLAYTTDKTIYLNTRYEFQTLTLVHEHMHSLGYGHKSAKDFASVPYQAGIVGEKYLVGCEQK